MTCSSESFLDRIETELADLADRRRVTGEPRYSVRLDLQGGGFIRRWSDERDEAMAMYRQAAASPLMTAVFFLDPIGHEMMAMTCVADDPRDELPIDDRAAFETVVERRQA